MDYKPQVYKDPLDSSERSLLMGYKGKSYMDTGYFFAPYIPLYNTPAVLRRSVPPALDPYSIDRIFSEYGNTESAKPAKNHRSITDPWEVSRFD